MSYIVTWVTKVAMRAAAAVPYVTHATMQLM